MLVVRYSYLDKYKGRECVMSKLNLTMVHCGACRIWDGCSSCVWAGRHGGWTLQRPGHPVTQFSIKGCKVELHKHYYLSQGIDQSIILKHKPSMLAIRKTNFFSHKLCIQGIKGIIWYLVVATLIDEKEKEKGVVTKQLNVLSLFSCWFVSGSEEKWIPPYCLWPYVLGPKG